MNVLSLFDGMSCGQIALQRLGKKVDKYYASEIDKHAIAATMANFPNTIQLGSVTEVKAKDLDRIDLLIGGSPCQGFSTAGKGLNFEDPRSKLFFEFVRLLKECRDINPDVKFMLENVRMKEEYENVISKFLGVNAIVINSALVSAQNRVRLYWTNIGQQPAGLFGDLESIIPQPKDKGILLKDILQEDVDEKYYLSDKALERIKRKNYSQPRINPDKTGTLNTKNNSGELSVDSGTTLIGVLNDNGILVESNNKANCIDANFHKGMDNHSQRTMVKKVIQMSQEKESNSNTQPFQQNRIYDSDGINPALSASLSTGSNAVYFKEKVRRLTPTECCRLQTVPDEYFNGKGISETQQYRMLGNGWTVDVICHILSFLR